MTNKTVFITGAAQGIGFELGKEFAKNGDRVVLTDIQGEAVEKVAASLRESGYNCTGLQCDVTSEQQIKWAMEESVRQYGTLDVLINNAGLQHVSFIEDFPTEKFESMIKIMLIAPFLGIKHALPIMKKQGFGRIINIASINGLIGFAGKSAYNSAKHGVIGLTKVAALEAAEHNITVNALCPGYVDTLLVRNQLEGLSKTRGVSLEQVLNEVIYPLVPQKRLLTVQEVAHYALFLASENSKGITGQAVVIDGGYTVQ